MIGAGDICTGRRKERNESLGVVVSLHRCPKMCGLAATVLNGMSPS